MPTRQLYNIRIPRDSQTNTQHQGLGSELEALSGPDTDNPIIEALGVQSGDHTIQASYAHKYAAKTASELEELMQASGFDYLPYYTPSQPGRSGDNWIVIQDGSVEAASVHEDQVQVVQGTFTPHGTTESHRRRLRVNPLEIPDSDYRNDFGNTDECLVAVPASATPRFWFDKESKSREDVVVESTVEAEGRTMELVDARAVSELTAPFDLIYNPDYAAAYQSGVVLWDTRGEDSKHDGEGDVQWQKCYRTSHEYSGVPVVDTGRLRLHLDRENGLQAGKYDPTTGEWTTTGLPDSEWSLLDRNITGIAPHKTTAQVEFQHPSEGVFALDLVAHRGRRVVQWLVPQSVSDPTPSGLVDLLEPVADEAVVRPQSSLGLIDRSEVSY